MNRQNFLEMIGFNPNPINNRENILSLAGGFLGIFFIILCSNWLLDPVIAVYIIPSMGASAVLLFAAPHAPFSQPWNIFAGHILSAVIGVACWQWIPNFTVAASSSVGLAIGLMYFTRSLHPPGGATALAFVIGSHKLHDLGYLYVLQPVLLNTTIIVLVAILFNNLFCKRRYPVSLHDKKRMAEPVTKSYPPINHEDFVYALSHIDTFVDIDEKDLLEIYSLATHRRVEQTKT